jgi:hypothetical protein
MRFKLYREYGALNSKPVFDAFEKGLQSLGHTVVDKNEDIAVIWSVLWQGRMAMNQHVYQQCQKNNKPIIIIEVGNLKRNCTWRVCLNHINGLGIFGNNQNIDQKRPEKLGVFLKPANLDRRPEILIATQHQCSLQWEGMPSMHQWVNETVQHIRQYSDRKIKVRSHPRSPLTVSLPGVELEIPKLITGTYDDFDIDYRYHCVINHNSGPAVQAAINGTPIICDNSSLASKISGNFSEIETIALPDRTDWFIKLCHTEWTVEEISKGIPLSRLI